MWLMRNEGLGLSSRGLAWIFCFLVLDLAIWVLIFFLFHGILPFFERGEM